MQFVAQSKIVISMLPQEQAGKTKGGAGLGSPRIKGPKVGRKKPGPTQRFSGRDRIDHDSFPIIRFCFQDDGAGFDEIKATSRFAFAQNDLAGVELSRHCAKNQKLEMMWTHALEERVSRQPLFQVGVTNAMRFAPELVGITFSHPPNLRAIAEEFGRWRMNRNVRRLDPIEVNKTLCRKGTELGLAFHVFQGRGHCDLPSHLGRMRIVSLGNFDLLVPLMGPYRFIFDFDEEICSREGRSVGASVNGEGDVSEKSVSHR
ncbi:MAG: hypothetical protein QOK24_1861 [Verrucomicrobiota bacterium]